MVGCSVFAAETDAEARRLFTSQQQAFTRMLRGRPRQAAAADRRYRCVLDAGRERQASRMLRCAFVGAKDTVRRQLSAFIAETQADEVIGQRHDLRPRRARAVVRDPGGGGEGAGLDSVR